MEIKNLRQAKPLPLFGVLSILVPIFGLICVLSIRDHAGTLDYLENSNRRLYIIWTTLGIGLVPILGAWVRHEKYRILRFIGLLLLLPYYLGITLICMAFATSHDWRM
jgi:hypothetical protein